MVSLRSMCPVPNVLIRLVCFLLLTALAIPTHAGAFSQGSRSVTLLVGSGEAFNESYTIVGGGFHYYVFDGLSLGAEAEFWLGGDPSIWKLSPQLQYVVNTGHEIRPYVGAFYRRAYIEDPLEDLDSIGYRLGVFLSSDPSYYLGAGLVFEDYQDCSETVFVSCSETYPEIVISISF